MGFSEKMRESLGAEGTRVKVTVPDEVMSRGSMLSATVTLEGGSRDAHIDTLIVRLVEADRHWIRNEDGGELSEQDAQDLPSRKGLSAMWTRYAIHEREISIDYALQAHQQHEIQIELEIPEQTKPSSVACSHMLNVQASIKGQIDPTGNVQLRVG